MGRFVQNSAYLWRKLWTLLNSRWRRGDWLRGVWKSFVRWMTDGMFHVEHWSGLAKLFHVEQLVAVGD